MTTETQNNAAVKHPSHPISRFAIPALADLPTDIREKILAVQEKSGFVPNVFLVLSRRPDEFRAFFAYHDALMVKESGSLTKADREMIVTTTSAKNNCLYCVMAHGAILRIYAKNPLVADQVAVNHHKADITPRQKAMLDFAVKVCLDSQSVGDQDYAELRAHGFDDEDPHFGDEDIPLVETISAKTAVEGVTLDDDLDDFCDGDDQRLPEE